MTINQPRRRVYLDIEATGLDPDLHEMWELAYAIGDGPILHSLVSHDFTNPDPVALRINRYLERTIDYATIQASVMSAFETDAYDALDGATIVAANPSFDASFLSKRWGGPHWHHRLWDVEAYAAGVLDLPELLGLADIASMLRDRGYPIPEPDHTAAGDVDTLRECDKALRMIRAGLGR